jgi:hypothetical protein
MENEENTEEKEEVKSPVKVPVKLREVPPGYEVPESWQNPPR